MDNRKNALFVALYFFITALFCNIIVSQLDWFLGNILGASFGMAGSILLILSRFLSSDEVEKREKREAEEDRVKEGKSTAEEEEEIEDGILGR
jgi:hypothetical protein